MFLLELSLRLIMAFASTVCFSLIFKVPAGELLFCGLSGAVSWLVYELAIAASPLSVVYANFLATLAVTVFTRMLSYRRKAPITIFLIAGIIPLAPGSGIYYTMYNMINGQGEISAQKGVETLKIAGVIALGIILVLSLPKRIFAGRGNPESGS